MFQLTPSQEHAAEYICETLDKLHWGKIDEHGHVKLPKSKKAQAKGPQGLTYGELTEILLNEILCMTGAMQERLTSMDQAYLP